jgi:hypothetical protein
MPKAWTTYLVYLMPDYITSPSIVLRLLKHVRTLHDGAESAPSDAETEHLQQPQQLQVDFAVSSF